MIPNLSLKDFDFNLPKELIAQTPIIPKDTAKMLEVNSLELNQHLVRHLPSLLNSKDLLVVNDTKVIPAKLIGTCRNSAISLNLHKCLEKNLWLAFVKNSRRLTIDSLIIFSDKFQAKIVDKLPNGEVKLFFSYEGDFYTVLQEAGHMPLPPYIKRDTTLRVQDNTDYQTIFAKEINSSVASTKAEKLSSAIGIINRLYATSINRKTTNLIAGSTASPTASLHFTKELLQALDKKGIKIAHLTLHVGAGTFLPVKTQNIFEHVMHEEFCSITKDTAKLINKTKTKDGRIIAVGSTVLRTLEHASLNGKVQPYHGNTNIFITPGYNFQIVDCLLTNFHLPKSTLFMLVCAFCGIDTMKKAYTYAITNNYRFFSYGDCTFLHKTPI